MDNPVSWETVRPILEKNVGTKAAKTFATALDTFESALIEEYLLAR
jgi:hypothetical protein